MAAALGLTVKDLEALEEASKMPLSLEMTVGGEGEGVQLKDVVPDREQTGAAAAIAELLRRQESLRELLDDLPPKEREILVDRFGLGTGVPMTLESIGQRHGRDARAGSADRGVRSPEAPAAARGSRRRVAGGVRRRPRPMRGPARSSAGRPGSPVAASLRRYPDAMLERGVIPSGLAGGA